jgi:hypothetical protein
MRETLQLLITHPCNDIEAEECVLDASNVPGEARCTFATHINFSRIHYTCARALVMIGKIKMEKFSFLLPFADCFVCSLIESSMFFPLERYF